MAALKTRPNATSVEQFLNAIPDPRKRNDSLALLDIMKKTTHEEPLMWGDSIVGFGRYHYKYASGREGDWFLTGFSPRKQSLTVYIMSGFRHHQMLMKKLGKHKTGKSCLYINKLDDVNLEVLQQLIAASVEHLAAKSRRG